jgi:hypothetical protein
MELLDYKKPCETALAPLLQADLFNLWDLLMQCGCESYLWHGKARATKIYKWIQSFNVHRGCYLLSLSPYFHPLSFPHFHSFPILLPIPLSRRPWIFLVIASFLSSALLHFDFLPFWRYIMIGDDANDYGRRDDDKDNAGGDIGRGGGGLDARAPAWCMHLDIHPAILIVHSLHNIYNGSYISWSSSSRDHWSWNLH